MLPLLTSPLDAELPVLDVSVDEESRTPTAEMFLGALQLEARRPDVATELLSKRMARDVRRQVSSTMRGYLSFIEADLRAATMGAAGETVVASLAERVVQSMSRTCQQQINLLCGENMFLQFGETELEMYGHNMIARTPGAAEEIDGCVILGDDADHLLFYDVTTSAQYLLQKLRRGEYVFQRLREAAMKCDGILVEKYHILIDKKESGPLGPENPALLQERHVPQIEGVKLFALPLRRHVSALRERALRLMLKEGDIEKRGGEYFFA